MLFVKVMEKFIFPVILFGGERDYLISIDDNVEGWSWNPNAKVSLCYNEKIYGLAVGLRISVQCETINYCFNTKLDLKLLCYMVICLESI